MKVIPIVLPNINWRDFVSETNASLGRSPTRSLDGAGIAPGSLLTFLQALGEFKNQNTNAISYLRSSSSLDVLQVVSITFLIECRSSEIYEVLKVGHMSIVEATQPKRGEELLIASATVRQWKEIIQRGSHLSVVKEVAAWFIKLGLRDLLADCELQPTRQIENF